MSVTAQKEGRRVYLVGLPFAAKDRAKDMGGKWDADRRLWWVGSGKAAEAEALVAELNAAPADPAAPKAKQKPDDIRLTGKGEYKGKAYYLGARTRDGLRVRCLTLPDASGDYLDFWADVTAVTVQKTYTPRERTFRGRTETEYTTLGGIARFLARQRNPATARGQCTECGSWGLKGQPCRDCGGEGSHQ